MGQLPPQAWPISYVTLLSWEEHSLYIKMYKQFVETRLLVSSLRVTLEGMTPPGVSLPSTPEWPRTLLRDVWAFLSKDRAPVVQLQLFLSAAPSAGAPGSQLQVFLRLLPQNKLLYVHSWICGTSLSPRCQKVKVGLLKRDLDACQRCSKWTFEP